MVKKRDPKAETAAKKAIEESSEEDGLQRMNRADDPEKAVMVHHEGDENLDPAPVEHQTESIVFGDLEFYTVDEPKVETEEIEDDLFSDFFEYKERRPMKFLTACGQMEIITRRTRSVARYVKLQRVTTMNVLRAANHVGDHHIQKTLTTRFVSDWRMKPYDQSTKTLASKSTFGGKKVCI